MRPPKLVFALAALTAALTAQQTRPDTSILLARIRTAVARHLSQLPNYMCHQRIERSLRPAESRKYAPLDTIKLDVAYVGGREMFGWPGAGKFEDKRIDELVGGNAAIGNGFFAAHARAVFLTNAPEFTYSGELDLAGRKCVKYDYRIPREKSEFVFRDGKNAAVVGYRGAFYADAKTLDLVRLDINVDDIPSGLGASKASDVLEYGRVRIGERDFLLPQVAEMSIFDLKGNESRNVVRLSACQQYVGESVLKFEDEPVAEAAAPKPVVTVALPPGTEIEAAFAQPVQGTPAIGDTVSATVLRDARKAGVVIVPKGATLAGRVTRVEKRRTRGFEYFIVGMAFSSFEGSGRRGEFLSGIDRIGSYGNTYHAPLSRGLGGPISIWNSVRIDFGDLRPGEGIIYVKGDTVSIPKGVPLTILVEEPARR